MPRSKPLCPRRRRRRRRTIAAMTLTWLTLSATAPLIALNAGAQNGHVASLSPNARAVGPTTLHDSAFRGAVVEVRSIDVPFTSLTLMILNATAMPEIARGRVLGAHVHTRGCADDAAASGPHYMHPNGDPAKPLAMREVWLDVRVDNRGTGIAFALFDWRIRKGDANSVVVHAEPTNPTTGAAGPRLLCTTIVLGQ